MSKKRKSSLSQRKKNIKKIDIVKKVKNNLSKYSSNLYNTENISKIDKIIKNTKKDSFLFFNNKNCLIKTLYKKNHINFVITKLSLFFKRSLNTIFQNESKIFKIMNYHTKLKKRLIKKKKKRKIRKKKYKNDKKILNNLNNETKYLKSLKFKKDDSILKPKKYYKKFAKFIFKRDKKKYKEIHDIYNPEFSSQNSDFENENFEENKKNIIFDQQILGSDEDSINTFISNFDKSSIYCIRKESQIEEFLPVFDFFGKKLKKKKKFDEDNEIIIKKKKCEEFNFLKKNTNENLFKKNKNKNNFGEDIKFFKEDSNLFGDEIKFEKNENYCDFEKKIISKEKNDLEKEVKEDTNDSIRKTKIESFFLNKQKKKFIFRN